MFVQRGVEGCCHCQHTAHTGRATWRTLGCQPLNKSWGKPLKVTVGQTPVTLLPTTEVTIMLSFVKVIVGECMCSINITQHHHSCASGHYIQQASQWGEPDGVRCDKGSEEEEQQQFAEYLWVLANEGNALPGIQQSSFITTSSDKPVSAAWPAMEPQLLSAYDSIVISQHLTSFLPLWLMYWSPTLWLYEGNWVQTHLHLSHNTGRVWELHTAFLTIKK